MVICACAHSLWTNFFSYLFRNLSKNKAVHFGWNLYMHIFHWLFQVLSSVWDIHFWFCWTLRGHDFSKSGFGPRTVMLCDQVHLMSSAYVLFCAPFYFLVLYAVTAIIWAMNLLCAVRTRVSCWLSEGPWPWWSEGINLLEEFSFFGKCELLIWFFFTHFHLLLIGITKREVVLLHWLQ